MSTPVADMERIVNGDDIVTPTHTTASITTSSGATSALAANLNRKYLLLQNDGANDVYIKVGADAAINAGIRVLANGGSYEMTRQIGNLMTGVIKGITISGTATLLITEGV